MSRRLTRHFHHQMSIVETCKKLGVSAYHFIYDRISQRFELPSLAELIRAKAAPNRYPMIAVSPQSTLLRLSIHRTTFSLRGVVFFFLMGIFADGIFSYATQ